MSGQVFYKDGWSIFCNTGNSDATQKAYGDFDVVSQNGKWIKYAERLFVDPMEPSEEEWLLFMLEYGSGFPNKTTKEII